MRALLASLLCIAALPAGAADGAALFSTHCTACHQPGGVGVPGLAPPLAGTLGERLKIAGRGYLPRVVTHGLTGPITVNGQRYAGAMPSFAAQLDDEALAAVLNHVVTGFNGDSMPEGHQSFSAAELADARADKLAPNEVRKLRDGPRKGSGS